MFVRARIIVRLPEGLQLRLQRLTVQLNHG